MLLTSLVFEVWVELYTLHGKQPPAVFRDVIAVPGKIVREEVAIVGIFMVVFGSIAICPLHARALSL